MHQLLPLLVCIKFDLMLLATVQATLKVKPEPDKGGKAPNESKGKAKLDLHILR